MERVTCTPRLPPSKKSMEAHHDVRPVADFHPSVWGDFFIYSTASDDAVQQHAGMKQRVEKLKEDVRGMFTKITATTSDHGPLEEQMELVDTLQRLGLAYHFQREISEALDRIYHEKQLVDREDLHTVALWFRLLRQEGYKVPSDVFNKFKDIDGHFRRSLASNVKGLLSLYEAANLGTPAEREVFDEAIAFCRHHLTPILDHLPPHLAAEVARALETPLIRRMKRLETRQYIEFYEATEGRNDLILKLAKLDFNLLQAAHRREIRNLTVWWKELGLIQKLGFARDRLVEGYFWAMGVYDEPLLARARIMMAKVIALLSVTDDIYDAYGTLEELHSFTSVIQRWDLSAVDQLPEYMKICFAAWNDTFKDFEDELMGEKKSYRVEYLKEQVKIVVLAYLEEAKWSNKGYVPSFEEHLRVSLITCSYQMLTCASFLGMGDVATKEAFDWVATTPKIVEASTIICRLMDDVVSFEFEQKRQHVVSTVQCYMKGYCVSKEKACQKLYEMIEYAWRDLNQECLQPTIVSLELLMSSLNLSRVIEVYYRHNSGYTESSKGTKDLITILIVKYIEE